jgi:hypothetical protein
MAPSGRPRRLAGPTRREVLLRFARGASVREIADGMPDVSSEEVDRLLLEVGMNRQRAAALVREAAAAPAAVEVAPDAVRVVSTEELLRRAASGPQRLQTLAARIEAYLDKLRGQLLEEEQLAKARAEVAAAHAALERATRELAERTALLRAGRVLRDRPAEVDTRSRRAAIRAWAAAEGISCSQRGRIAVDVEARYDQAHAGGSDG